MITLLVSFVPCHFYLLMVWCEYVREGIIATGAADDAIRLFVENKEGLVLIILLFHLFKKIILLSSLTRG